ncbi:MAG: Uma2 family endonuclease [Spirochaetaceae bacterium]|nr:Uma2 family endonuclease [Spirochaetaceae bacterium]
MSAGATGTPAEVRARPAQRAPHRAPIAVPGGAAAPSAAAFDMDTLVTEDDTPVDNMPSEKQQRLLTEPLYSSWSGPGRGRTFLAAANVGVFPEPRNPAIVPDVFVSLDVQVHRNWWDKAHRSYFVWEFGKPPELVVEIVSSREGNEVGSKRQRYAGMGVEYYVIHDPLHQVMADEVRIYRLRGGRYERQESAWFAELGLGLTLWDGVFEEVGSRWLRWRDEHGVLIPTGKERADEQHQRAERLAALLRRAGIDPDRE